MKKIIYLSALFALLATCSYGQEKKDVYVGASFSMGAHDYFTFEELEGAGSYNGKGFYSVGVDVSYPLSKRFDLVSGFSYSYCAMDVHYLGGDGKGHRYNDKLKMYSVPLQLNYHFWKYCFLNGGLFLNTLSNSEFSVGTGIGAGAEYTFKSGFTLSLNPYIRWNGIITNYQLVLC